MATAFNTPLVSSPWALTQAEIDAYDADRAADDAADAAWEAEQEAEAWHENRRMDECDYRYEEYRDRQWSARS